MSYIIKFTFALDEHGEFIDSTNNNHNDYYYNYYSVNDLKQFKKFVRMIEDDSHFIDDPLITMEDILHNDVFREGRYVIINELDGWMNLNFNFNVFNKIYQTKTTKGFIKNSYTREPYLKIIGKWEIIDPIDTDDNISIINPFENESKINNEKINNEIKNRIIDRIEITDKMIDELDLIISDVNNEIKLNNNIIDNDINLEFDYSIDTDDYTNDINSDDIDLDLDVMYDIDNSIDNINNDINNIKYEYLMNQVVNRVDNDNLSCIIVGDGVQSNYRKNIIMNLIDRVDIDEKNIIIFTDFDSVEEYNYRYPKATIYTTYDRTILRNIHISQQKSECKIFRLVIYDKFDSKPLSCTDSNMRDLVLGKNNLGFIGYASYAYSIDPNFRYRSFIFTHSERTDTIRTVASHIIESKLYLSNNEILDILDRMFNDDRSVIIEMSDNLNIGNEQIFKIKFQDIYSETKTLARNKNNNIRKSSSYYYR